MMLRNITEPLIVYSGSIITLTLGVAGPSDLATTKDVIMILVGLATFIYTIMKIIELRIEIRRERAQKKVAQKKHERLKNENRD